MSKSTTVMHEMGHMARSVARKVRRMEPEKLGRIKEIIARPNARLRPCRW